MKTLRDLIETSEPAWPLVLKWMRDASRPVEALPPSRPANEDVLVALQVTVRSPMGAIVYESGGVLVDHGWLRILGSGHARLSRSLSAWNAGREQSFLLVADDVVGGFFAVDGGGLGIRPGQVAYWAPDTLRWEGLDMSFSDFVQWTMSKDLASFYELYRGPDWERRIKAISGDQAFLIYPLPIMKGPAYHVREWRVVPVAELYGLEQDVAAQVRDLPPGTKIQIELGE